MLIYSNNTFPIIKDRQHFYCVVLFGEIYRINTGIVPKDRWLYKYANSKIETRKEYTFLFEVSGNHIVDYIKL